MSAQKEQQQQQPRPKALLFDIGGVCVVSPFQAILDYEKRHGIPPGYVNFSISASKPDGAWHKMERGQMELSTAFFDAFNADLRKPELWREWVQRARRNNGNDTTADIPPVPEIDGEWLIWEIVRIAREPDKHMAPALVKLRDSKKFLMGALSNTMPIPKGHPYDAPLAGAEDVRAIFDPFVASAIEGVRKPERVAYELALKRMRERYVALGWGSSGDELQPQDIVFLDDIGENLKMGRQVGFRTVKVILGDTRSAVKELETITGLSLLDGETAKL